MDTAHCPQELGYVKPMEELVSSSSMIITNNTGTAPTSRPQQVITAMEKRVRPQKEQALNCPRCNSTNTKFCYYNNYSLTQPRYFCKTCRRYWTEGGSLRNVPVGGGSRKNKKPSSSSSYSTSISTVSPSFSKKLITDPNPKLIQEGAQDLNLSNCFPLNEFGACSTNGSTGNNINASTTGGMINYPFMPMHPMPPITEFSMSFPFNGNINGGVSASGGRLLFPFEETRLQVSSNASSNGSEQFEQNKGLLNDPPGFWNGSW